MQFERKGFIMSMIGVNDPQRVVMGSRTSHTIAAIDLETQISNREWMMGGIDEERGSVVSNCNNNRQYQNKKNIQTVIDFEPYR